MFFPIGDENPRERTPYVNYALLASNILVFLFTSFPQPTDAVLVNYAMIPDHFRLHTLFTSMFLHAGIAHLVGNMLFLWICGDNVEDRLGHVGYLAFYLVCGAAAGYAHLLTTRHPELPTLGASGAISGVLAAYVVFFPRHRIKMLFWFGFFINRFLVPAWAWIGFWFVQQLLFNFLGSGGGVAYMAHIGGFLAALPIALPVRLFQNGRRPHADLPGSLLDSSRNPEAGPFLTVDEPAGMIYLDDVPGRWALLSLHDSVPPGLATAVAAHSGEAARDVARRLAGSRGLLVRGVPRMIAERIQKEVRRAGLDTVLVPDVPPPVPRRVEGADWDDEVLRVRVEGQDVVVPWSAPFLYVGARVEGGAILDVFVSRTAAFRFEGKPAAVARAVVENRRGAALNEGVRVLADFGAWGWLDFPSRAAYDEYVFWLYNLILSQVPIHRG